MNDNKIMNKAADNIRILAASMVQRTTSVSLLLQWLRKPSQVTPVVLWVVQISLTPCIQNSWFTTPRILLGRDVTVSSWILATWLQCSIASSVSSANTRWRI